MTGAISRRVAMLAGGALIVAGRALAQAPERFFSVAVDVGPLRAKGLGPYADGVGTDLAAALREAFADRLGGDPRGPRLVVRITALSLRSYAGSDSGPLGFGGATQTDYLEGEALVLGPGNAVLLRHPQLSALPASSGGAWYDPDAEHRRVAALCGHFAGWLRRAI